MSADPVEFPVANIQRPMTLVMPLADPSHAGVLALGQQVFATAGVRLGADLDQGGTVHFARFVIIGHNLVMASAYDGEFADYIQMFIHTMGEIFDEILAFIADAPPTPVRKHPSEFVDWVLSHDVAPIGFYSGYPSYTVAQIRSSLALPNNARDTPPGQATLPAEMVADVQGLILRGFGHPYARHIVLSITDPAVSRRRLAEMASPISAESQPFVPRVTAGATWTHRPPVCLSVALTAVGLRALGVPQASLDTFPTEFLEGAAQRSAHAGDVWKNAPEFWDPELRDPNNVHVILSLYACDEDTRERATLELRSALSGAMNVVATYDAALFPDNPQQVHFGYRDNISQPIIDGDPISRPADGQPLAAAGEFVLGYNSQYTGVTLEVPSPLELGRNGSFTAWRVLEQDVVGFEAYLDQAGAATGHDSEWVAAKVVGRWRNGIPLVLSPETDNPQPPIPFEQWNNYGYQQSDADGLRCPVGSHMRRANPRDEPMNPVGDGHARRIMRRGMPYGPKWSRSDGPDNKQRGLIGHFIGASLLLQFETIMGEWLNQGLTSPAITGTSDALIGVLAPGSAPRCPIPTRRADGTVDPNGTMLPGLAQFVRTRGCAYGFLPSMTALRWLATIE